MTPERRSASQRDQQYSIIRLTSVTSEIRRRARRLSYLRAELLAEPAWDIMLHVYHSELVQRRTTVSELAEQTGFPITTLDRWLKMLEVDGLVHRRMDPNDPISVRVSLSAKGLEAMDGFFSESP